MQCRQFHDAQRQFLGRKSAKVFLDRWPQVSVCIGNIHPFGAETD
jgi:hypothetical protein